MLAVMPVLPFDDACVAAYRRIVEEVGFSRRKVIDRMIAATALVHQLTLVTLNGADFTDVPGLDLDAWPAPERRGWRHPPPLLGRADSS